MLLSGAVAKAICSIAYDLERYEVFKRRSPQRNHKKSKYR
jgi:Ni,Fe-hydrogenase III small subunit